MFTKFVISACALLLLGLCYCDDNSTDGDNGTPPGPNPIPQEGLVAKYSFSGDANDESTNGNHGTVHGATLVANRKDVANSAYSFDGVNDSIVFPFMSYDDESNVSISLWAKLTNLTGVKYFVLANGFAVWQYYDSLGIAVDVDGFGTNSARGAIVFDEWVHMVGTFDGETIRCYHDGTLKMETPWPGTMSFQNRNLDIGFFGPNLWEGTVDDIRIYDRTLSLEAVDSLFNE